MKHNSTFTQLIQSAHQQLCLFTTEYTENTESCWMGVESGIVRELLELRGMVE